MFWKICQGKKTNENEDRLDFNEILHHLGPFGLWQKLQIALLFTSALSAGVAVVVFAFSAYVPRYRCKIPHCDVSETFEDDFGQPFDFVKLSIGSLEEGKKTLDELGQTCKYLSFANSTSTTTSTTCSNLTSPPIEVTCSRDDLIFDQSIVQSSLVSHFGFTCDRHFWRSFYNALYMGGMLIGSFFIGIISDHFGRRNALMVSVILVSGGGTLTAFVGENLTAFAFLRLFTGMGGMGCYMAAYVMAAETSLPSHTVLMTSLTGLGFACGELILGLEAYHVRDWKTLQLVAYAPMILLLGLRFLVPESTRWLIAKGRTKEARKQIQFASKLNGKSVPEHLLRGTKKECEAEGCNGAENKIQPKPMLLDLFRPLPIMFRTLNMCLQWFSVTMVYYGLSFASTSLSGDPYLNYTLSVLGELPSFPFALLFINRWGRRPMLGTMQLTAGICCIIGGSLMDVIPFVEDPTTQSGLQTFQKFLTMLGKFGAASTFGMVYLYTSELYPTTIRNTAIGCCSCIARIGGILSLLMGSLGKIWKPFPMVIMGSIATVAGCLAFLFPETTGEKLPETIEDALNIGKDSQRNLCGCKRRPKNTAPDYATKL